MAALGETTGDWALRQMRQRMLASPTGRQVLDERPRITVRASSKLSAQRRLLRIWLCGVATFGARVQVQPGRAPHHCVMPRYTACFMDACTDSVHLYSPLQQSPIS